MTKVQGEREQKVRQGPGVTSGLGGRGDLRRSSLGSWPRGKNAVADPKQTKQTKLLENFAHPDPSKDTFHQISATK